MRVLLALSLALFSPAALAAEAEWVTHDWAPQDWEGNHPDAKSEAWTWMGHLQYVDEPAKGVGILHYYTRNDAGLGSMNFKTTSLSWTQDGVGQSMETKTIYSAEAKHASLSSREDLLDLTWKANGNTERAYRAPMTAADTAELQAELAAYPGLRVPTGFTPEKTVLDVLAGNQRPMKLVLYSIWPKAAPNRESADPGHIRFLGEDDTYTFSQPMMLAHGTLGGRAMTGLMFLDRQWGKHYFGSHIFDNLLDLLKFNHALRYSHTWSAFQAYNARTQEWSFFHLWNQFDREDGRPDALTDYSGLVWVTGGERTGQVDQGNFSWDGSSYVKHGGRDILLDYANGRSGYFPTRFELATKDASLGNLQAELVASPAKQFMNQPIYLYEGYASGKAHWNGDELDIRGRIESSRLLFRQQDYREMLRSLRAQSEREYQQPSLQSTLKWNLSSPFGALFFPLSWFFRGLADLEYLANDMDLKLAIFGKTLSGAGAAADPSDPAVTTYR